jgi:hypothetical protein
MYINELHDRKVFDRHTQRCYKYSREHIINAGAMALEIQKKTNLMREVMSWYTGYFITIFIVFYSFFKIKCFKILPNYYILLVIIIKK